MASSHNKCVQTFKTCFFFLFFFLLHPLLLPLLLLFFCPFEIGWYFSLVVALKPGILSLGLSSTGISACITTLILLAAHPAPLLPYSMLLYIGTVAQKHPENQMTLFLGPLPEQRPAHQPPSLLLSKLQSSCKWLVQDIISPLVPSCLLFLFLTPLPTSQGSEKKSSFASVPSLLQEPCQRKQPAQHSWMPLLSAAGRRLQ